MTKCEKRDMCMFGANKESVAIVTLPGNFNFGNRLQLYATYSIYSKMGFRAEALTLKGRAPKYVCTLIKKGKIVARRLLNFSPMTDPESLSSPERAAAFRKFSSMVPERVVASAGEIDPDEYSFFSCGSDQVWNPSSISDGSDSGFERLFHLCVDSSRIRSMVGWFFLGYFPRSKRIALAPSIGMDELKGSRIKVIDRGVRNFDRISVREYRGAEQIKNLTGLDVEVVCDPTLIMTADEWREIADDRLVPSGRYVLTYLLGSDEGVSDLLDKVTEGGTLPVIPLSDRQKPGEPDAGPADFISLIDHAEHVVTDSFHAAVFASIMQTKLTIVHRKGGASMFSRLETLTRMLGIESKVYGSSGFDLSRAGDWKGVPNAIERERKRFMEYLEGCLDA